MTDEWIRTIAFRKQRVKWACQKHGTGARSLKDPPLSEEKKYIWVSDALQLVFCEVPKAASTSWKKSILQALGVYREISSLNVHAFDFPKYLRRLDTYSTNETEYRLKNYLKFFVLRHPADRLVSAYRSKIEVWWPGKPRALATVGNYVRKHYQNLPEIYPTDVPFNDSELVRYIEEKNKTGEELWRNSHVSNVTFRDFIRYIGDHPVTTDKHWTPASRLCHPCFIDYDVVAYAETLTTDAANILQLIEADTTLKFPDSNRQPCPQCLRTSKMFEPVSEEEMSRIREIYELDWAMRVGETDIEKSP
ncbi:carbohydrate sulfotransferase 11-like isoform X2 [Lingula anatina]|nr:carbohydrate sulfotransferase 11-like isoform X2 [Lingula anatina]|eukprot:XP_013378853.1 carbohydrate sulfotransferase 11-like isoform X2 [Lingula anatina]